MQYTAPQAPIQVRVGDQVLVINSAGSSYSEEGFEWSYHQGVVESLEDNTLTLVKTTYREFKGSEIRNSHTDRERKIVKLRMGVYVIPIRQSFD